MDTPIKNYSFFQLAIIIPFYNEEKRTNKESFISFAKENSQALLILVNDGSTDNTQKILEEIQIAVPDSIEIIKLDKNLGKGNAIRSGMIKANNNNLPFTGFMDADLSAPFDEILKLYKLITDNKYDAVFGSRLKKLGSQIQRSLFRHLSGRLIATMIDSRFKIGCYDTQCSAKIFKTTLLQKVIEPPFHTRWFFDVEIILRLKKQNSNFKVVEVPLDKWEHKPGSKINGLSIFSVLKEMITLFKNY